MFPLLLLLLHCASTHTYTHIHMNDVVFDVLSRLRKLTFNVFRLLCSYACTCTVCQCQCQCQSQTRPDQCERECGYVNGHVFVYHNKLTYLITGFLHSLKKKRLLLARCLLMYYPFMVYYMVCLNYVISASLNLTRCDSLWFICFYLALKLHKNMCSLANGWWLCKYL